MIRSQCAPCPWRDLEWMRAEWPQVVDAQLAAGAPTVVCHTRCGPCDGPIHAGLLEATS